MSSHHIVREKQEPALLIANGEQCSMDLMNQLLEWSPTVIVLDGAIDSVIDKGIKVDILLGDFDSQEMDLQTIKESQHPIRIIHTPDQEKTDLENHQKLVSTELDTTKKQLDTIRNQIKDQEKSIADANKILTLEKSIANYEDDRKHLIAGEPCSLCGSTEHPFVKKLTLVIPSIDKSVYKV